MKKAVALALALALAHLCVNKVAVREYYFSAVRGLGIRTSGVYANWAGLR